MAISRVISPFVPGPLKPRARALRDFLNYEFRVRLLRQDPFVPPPALHPVGSGDYRKHGDEFFDHFKILAGLTPQDRILDIGCGTGRMARPLTSYLQDGTYDGFDIVKPAIDWCRRVYTRRHPNFTFHYADLYSELYNRAGKHSAAKFQLPFQTHTFDFVFLTSVFTHMLPDAIDNYLGEIERMMKPQGRCLATFFLITPESRRLMKSGAARIEFLSNVDGYYIADPDSVESGVAYPESAIREFYQRHELQIAEPIRYGFWSGRKDGLSFQDIVLATH